MSQRPHYFASWSMETRADRARLEQGPADDEQNEDEEEKEPRGPGRPAVERMWTRVMKFDMVKYAMPIGYAVDKDRAAEMDLCV